MTDVNCVPMSAGNGRPAPKAPTLTTPLGGLVPSRMAVRSRSPLPQPDRDLGTAPQPGRGTPTPTRMPAPAPPRSPQPQHRDELVRVTRHTGTGRFVPKR